MRLLAVLSLLLVALVAGCGGDDDGGGGEDALSREEFIERADATCARIDRQVVSINNDARAARTIEQLRPVIDRSLRLYDQGLAEIDRLEPPEEIADDVDDFLGAVREQRRLLAEARDKPSLEEAAPIFRTELPRVVRRRDRAADAVGFEVCGGDAADPDQS